MLSLLTLSCCDSADVRLAAPLSESPGTRSKDYWIFCTHSHIPTSYDLSSKFDNSTKILVNDLIWPIHDHLSVVSFDILSTILICLRFILRIEWLVESRPLQNEKDGTNVAEWAMLVESTWQTLSFSSTNHHQIYWPENWHCRLWSMVFQYSYWEIKYGYSA